MAKKIIYDYDVMTASSAKIAKIAEQYQTAGNNLINGINAACEEWEGASKDKFMTLMTSITKTVQQDIPNMVTGLSELLNNNITNMQNADEEIASKIPESIN